MLQRGAMQSIAGYSSAGHGSAGAVQSGATAPLAIIESLLLWARGAS